jgi:hypothetical protein
MRTENCVVNVLAYTNPLCLALALAGAGALLCLLALALLLLPAAVILTLAYAAAVALGRLVRQEGGPGVREQESPPIALPDESYDLAEWLVIDEEPPARRTKVDRPKETSLLRGPALAHAEAPTAEPVHPLWGVALPAPVRVNTREAGSGDGKEPMDLALALVRGGKAVRAAAREAGVPESTLRRKWKATQQLT